jgi:hypothetical protein
MMIGSPGRSGTNVPTRPTTIASPTTTSTSTLTPGPADPWTSHPPESAAATCYWKEAAATRASARALRSSYSFRCSAGSRPAFGTFEPPRVGALFASSSGSASRSAGSGSGDPCSSVPFVVSRSSGIDGDYPRDGLETAFGQRCRWRSPEVLGTTGSGSDGNADLLRLDLQRRLSPTGQEDGRSKPNYPHDRENDHRSGVGAVRETGDKDGAGDRGTER